MAEMLDSNLAVPHQQVFGISKRSQCGSTSSNNEDYNLGLHIFAVFLIMTCGTAACSFPVLVKAFPKLAISRHALFVSRHFGTGVLIALAFAHLLPTAFENLWDDCLPYFWTEGYDAMPGVIAMISALAVMLVEMGFTLQGVRHTHNAEAFENPRGPQEGLAASNTSYSRRADSPRLENGKGAASQALDEESSKPSSQSDPRLRIEDTEHNGRKSTSVSNSSTSQQGIPSKQSEQRMILQCLLLEAGILFHSVFIGLSISLSTGTTFIALMVAISFHQIFEGLALGGRIAAIPSLQISSPKPWAMAFAYGLTCPLGQAIGLGLRKSYDPEGMTALLVVGIANAISAGMILYAGLVQLLGEDLLSEESYRTLSLRSRLEATVALVLGCALMALIAIWA